MDFIASPWFVAAIFMVGVIAGIGATMLCDRLVPAPDMTPHLTVHAHGPLSWPAIDPSGLGREFGPERVTNLQ